MYTYTHICICLSLSIYIYVYIYIDVIYMCPGTPCDYTTISVQPDAIQRDVFTC